MDTLVLSSSYQPMHHVTWQEAISMWFAGRVEIVEVYKERVIKTVDVVYNVPAVVRFIGNVVKRFKVNRKVKFSRDNIFCRDEGRCQYCSDKLKNKEFTLDHVVPSSQGGRRTWQNIVTCCTSCNQKKGNRTPEKAGMRLIKKPKMPEYISVVVDGEIAIKKDIPDAWKNFLGGF